LSEALARVRNDSVHSRPAEASATDGIVSWLWDRARALPSRAYVSAALLALLVGIAINALLLQHERHPAPLFARANPHLSPSAPMPPVPPAQPDPPRERTVPAPAPLPPPPPARTATTSQSRPTDQIGDLLRGEPQDDQSRLVFAAQSALARLGYAIKADGAEGAATEQALHDFERSHGLPLTTEITPHLVRQLSSSAHAAGR